MQSPLTTSPRGLELIRSFEKFEPKAYLCPAGKWTIGYGHVIRQSEPQLRTKTLTRGEAEQLLRADCHTAEIYLSAVLPDWVRPHHFDALVSFCFNCGIKAFDGSTLRVKLKAGDRFTAKGAVLEGDALQHKGPLALVELQNGDDAPSYVAGTENFYAITRYNWSSYYAMAVLDLGREVATALAASSSR